MKKKHSTILSSLRHRSNTKLAREHNVKLLKKTYNNGLITLKEYTTALKNYGITTDAELPAKIIETINKIEKNSTKEINKIEKNTIDNKKVEYKTSVFKNNLSNILNKQTEECAFILNDGRKLHSIRELIDALEQMNPEVFNYHTGQGRNDFANWIRNVFGEEEMATLITKYNKEELRAFFKELQK